MTFIRKIKFSFINLGTECIVSKCCLEIRSIINIVYMSNAFLHVSVFQQKHKNQVKTTNRHFPCLALANKLIVGEIRYLTQLNGTTKSFAGVCSIIILKTYSGENSVSWNTSLFSFSFEVFAYLYVKLTDFYHYFLIFPQAIQDAWC